MKPIDFQTLIENINIYEEEICRIFEKLREKDLKAKTNILSYDSSTYFERVEWDMSDETNISVRYYDDRYDFIKIPVRILFNNEEIDKWIQELISNKTKEREQKEELEKEERERAEYERLAIKFGKIK